MRRLSPPLPLLFVTLLGCSPEPVTSTKSAATSTSSAPALEATATATAADVKPPIDKADLLIRDSQSLQALGASFQCEERVYLEPPRPHITWWGWASPKPPAQLFEELSARLPAAGREGNTMLRLAAKEGENADVTVSVGDASVRGSVPRCSEAAPEGTKSLVVVALLPKP